MSQPHHRDVAYSAALNEILDFLGPWCTRHSLTALEGIKILNQVNGYVIAQAAAGERAALVDAETKAAEEAERETK